MALVLSRVRHHQHSFISCIYSLYRYFWFFVRLPPAMATISLLRLLLSVFFLLFHPAMAVLVNVTVDDAGQDSYTGAQIIYSPANAWSLGPLCKDCTAHPDPGSTFNGTWHDGFFDPATNTVLNASFQFEGTSRSSTSRSCRRARRRSTTCGASSRSCAASRTRTCSRWTRSKSTSRRTRSGSAWSSCRGAWRT